MPGWFEVSRNDAGRFTFTLKAPNGEVILRSELYTTRASALNGVRSVTRNCRLDERYERKVAADGRPYFTLKARNHQVVATSQLYKSAASRDAGIASVKANGEATTVRDTSK